MRNDLDRAIALLNKRQYASFWEWTDKEGKELGVGEQLVGAINATFDLGLTDIAVQRPDPPDLTCRNNDGQRVGIELAELVCEESVRRNAQGEAVYRVWRPGDVTRAVSDLLAEKDGKAYHGGPFTELYVCLFTDEPALTAEAAREELASASFGPFRQINRSFLLFSYQPKNQTYPVIALDHHA